MQRTSFYLKSLFALALTLAVGAGLALAQDSYWTNSSGSFGTSGNWSNGTPGLATVWFGNGQTFTVTMDGNASTRGVVVTNGTTVTIDLNDGTARTWEAAGPAGLIETRNPKIEVRGSTLIITDSGTIDANNLPIYQAWPGLLLSGGSTAIISKGAYVNVGYVGSVVLGATDKLIVTDPGTQLHSDDMRSTAGSSTVVTNGGYFNGVYWYGGGDLIVTGPGSVAQFLHAIDFATSVKITDGGRIDDTSGFNTPIVLIGGGSAVSTGQVSCSVIGDQYNSYSWKITTNGVLDIIGDYLEVRDGHSTAAQSSILTLDDGTIAMQTNAELRVRNNNLYTTNEFGGILRGRGTIRRRTASGDNFKVLNDGLIQPGDTTATPAIGTLTVVNGNLFQTNAVRPGAGHRFDFNPSVAGAADLIDVTGGAVTITVGSNVFNVISGATAIGFGKWHFLKANTITYTPASDNLSNLVAGLTMPDATAGFTNWTYGVVTLPDGRQALELSINRK